MADGLDPKQIAVVLLMVSILFHYFSFSFTIVAYDYSDYDVSLDIMELYSSGILLGEWDENNITFANVSWTVFEIGNETIRGAWNSWITGTGLIFQKEAEFFTLQPWIDFRWKNIEGGLIVRNETIIALYDNEVNHTMIHGITGYVMIIQDPLDEGNITKAVMETGILNIVIGENLAWASEPDLNSFTSWYIGLVTGSESWGLPPSFRILVQIMTMLGIFSGIFLLIEARRLIRVV